MSDSTRIDPLFTDRSSAGQALSRRGLQVVDAVCLALTPGGVAVAHPYVSRIGGSLHALAPASFADPAPEDDTRLPPRRRTPSASVVEGVTGRDVVLFDDGLGPLPALAAAAAALRAGAPRRLVLAVPAMTPLVSAFFRSVDRVVTVGRLPPGALLPPLYDEPPPSPALAHALLLDVAARPGRRGARLVVLPLAPVEGAPRRAAPVPRTVGAAGPAWFLPGRWGGGSGLDE